MNITPAIQKICLSCMECCKWMTFTLYIDGSSFKDYLEYYKKRGCRVKVRKLAKQKGSPVRRQLTVMIKKDCPELTSFGCKSYPVRPKLCRKYDGRTDEHMETCKLRRMKNGN